LKWQAAPYPPADVDTPAPQGWAGLATLHIAESYRSLYGNRPDYALTNDG